MDEKLHDDSIKKYLVLLVEDNDINRELVRIYLQGMPIELVNCISGENALVIIEELKFDLVLMDVSLPGMDGFETVKAIRQTNNNKDVPVIMFTAHDSTDLSDIAAPLNISGLLFKPFKKDDLISIINKFLILTENNPDKSEKNEISRGRKKLLPLFYTKIKDDSKDLKEYLAEKDYYKIGYICHGLRGVGALFGYPELAHMGEEIEFAINQDNTDLANCNIKKITDLIDTILDRDAMTNFPEYPK
jgi:CheY-like chemotaxis protein